MHTNVSIIVQSLPTVANTCKVYLLVQIDMHRPFFNTLNIRSGNDVYCQLSMVNMYLDSLCDGDTIEFTVQEPLIAAVFNRAALAGRVVFTCGDRRNEQLMNVMNAMAFTNNR